MLRHQPRLYPSDQQGAKGVARGTGAPRERPCAQGHGSVMRGTGGGFMEGDMRMFLTISLLVLFGGLAIAGLAFGLSHLLFRLFGRTSGLDRLATLYPAAHPPEGQVHRNQRIAVGSVYYKDTADICIGEQGLYLWVRPFLARYRPALIPWQAFTGARPTYLYWQSAVRLSVGDPAITSIVFTQGLYQRMKPYLSFADV